MYKVVRTQLDGVTEIEVIGIMTPEDFAEYTYDNFVSEEHGAYKAVFANKEEADIALAALKENGSDVWLLGVNPETGDGEALSINFVGLE